MKKRKGLKAKILYEGKYIRMVRQKGWEYVQRCNSTGVVIILAMTDQREVLFVSQYRVPVNAEVVEFPAGLINDGSAEEKEDVLMAARRELLEETGYLAKNVFQVTEGSAGSGMSADILTIVQATGLKKVGGGGGDDTENITVYRIPLDRVESWIKRQQRRGRLIDPKIYAGLYFLNKYNKTTFKRAKGG